MNLCENGSGFRDTVLGFCRREVCSDTVAELGRISNLDQILTDDTGKKQKKNLTFNFYVLYLMPKWKND